MMNKNKIGGIITLESVLVVLVTLLMSLAAIYFYSSQQSKWIATQLECKKDCETTVVAAEDGKKILTNKEGRKTIIDKNKVIQK